jgi:hypothetical protein
MPIAKRRGVNGAPIDPALAAMGDAYLGSRGKHAQPLPDPPARGVKKPAIPGQPTSRAEARFEYLVSVLQDCFGETDTFCRTVALRVAAAATGVALPEPPQPLSFSSQFNETVEQDELRLLRELRDSIVFRRSCPLCLQGDLDYRFSRDLAPPFPFPDQAGPRLSLRAVCPSCGQAELRPGPEELRGILFVVTVVARPAAGDRPVVEGFRAPDPTPAKGAGPARRGGR